MHPANLQRSTTLYLDATRDAGDVADTGNVKGGVCVDERGGFAADLFAREQEGRDGVGEWVLGVSR